MDAESLESLARAEPEIVDDADGRKRRGNATRESILQAAADLGSVEGLEGVTIGRLATELNMSKSGLFAHFGSKEELQLATIDAARRRFVDHVVRPSRHLPRGRARLEALLEDWLRYFRAEVFPGGCFFCNIKAEFDSRPDNAVRAIVIEDDAPVPRLPRARDRARPRRPASSTPRSSPAQLAFEFDALGSAANQQFQLTHDRAIFDRAATGMRSRLKAA